MNAAGGSDGLRRREARAAAAAGIYERGSRIAVHKRRKGGYIGRMTLNVEV